jgi:hypothetical protein
MRRSPDFDGNMCRVVAAFLHSIIIVLHNHSAATWGWACRKTAPAYRIDCILKDYTSSVTGSLDKKKAEEDATFGLMKKCYFV